MYDEGIADGTDIEPERPSRLRPLVHWWRAATAVHRDDNQQAAKTIQAFLVFSVITNTGYTIFYLLLDTATLSHVLGVNVTATVAFIVSILLARRERQLAASLVGLSAAAAEILLCTSFLGWSSGFHLFLLASGQLVFMVFTDRQAVFRWLYLALAAGVFLFCQLSIGRELGPSSFAEGTRTVLFSLNVVGTGALMFGLATIAHLREKTAAVEARAATARAEYLANTDALTGLVNRRPVMVEFNRLEALEAGSFCVGIADLDNFKELNDTYGHECGDRVLAAVGRAFRSHIRSTDLVGRWGGEEFIFVLPETALEDAANLMERLRGEVVKMRVSCGEHVHTVSASFGVADGEVGSPSFRAVKRADDAMYDAKAAGRNAVRMRSLASGESATPSPRRATTGRKTRAKGTGK
jgi:diguanylate cyclase (GGDEF)-like protein